MISCDWTAARQPGRSQHRGSRSDEAEGRMNCEEEREMGSGSRSASALESVWGPAYHRHFGRPRQQYEVWPTCHFPSLALCDDALGLTAPALGAPCRMDLPPGASMAPTAPWPLTLDTLTMCFQSLFAKSTMLNLIILVISTWLPVNYAPSVRSES
jgi:hypothetical protein